MFEERRARGGERERESVCARVRESEREREGTMRKRGYYTITIDSRVYFSKLKEVSPLSCPLGGE